MGARHKGHDGATETPPPRSTLKCAASLVSPRDRHLEDVAFGLTGSGRREVGVALSSYRLPGHRRGYRVERILKSEECIRNVYISSYHPERVGEGSLKYPYVRPVRTGGFGVKGATNRSTGEKGGYVPGRYTCCPSSTPKPVSGRRLGPGLVEKHSVPGQCRQKTRQFTYGRLSFYTRSFPLYILTRDHGLN